MDLKRELKRAKHEGFISLEAVHRIINEETLDAYFRGNGHQLLPADLQKILLEAPRLFAIHVLLDRGCDVQKYLSRGYGDKDLPFLKMPDGPEFGSPQAKESLYWGQWQIPATLVPTEHKSFPKVFKAPFAFEAPQAKARGAFGHVYEVRVADGHLPGYSSNQLLALKKIRVDPTADPADHETVMREIHTLRARRHNCIVPLIASWTAAVLESEPEVLYLNLLFPYARTDLKQWLYAREDPEEWKERPECQRKEYIYDTILSISSAVVFVHREIEGFISSHHDIKPANILLFGRTWKLADFGRSHLLRQTVASDTEGILGTYTYQPPEYRDSLGRKAEKRHGRAFDVWSLACIIIELLTIAVHGWNRQQLSLFRQSRIDNRCRPKRIPTEQYGRDDSFLNNMHAVHDWTRQLLKHDGSSNLRSVLNIVETMMIEEESHRHLSWEIYLDLYELLRPNATMKERETESRATVQHPSAHHGKREHNPLRRAVKQKNMPRIKWLLKKGWFDHPVDLPIIDSEDEDSWKINIWIRTARLMKGLNWRRVVQKAIRNSPSLAADAQASGPSQEHQLPDLDSSKKISMAVEALESSRSQTAPRKGTMEQDENGMTYLHRECQKPHFWHVLQYSGKTSRGKWDNIMTHEDSLGWLPLHYAAENGASNIIEHLLNSFSLKSAVLVAWRDHEGRTPLHLASRQGNIDAIKSLLHAHMDPVKYSKMKDNQNQTACDVARDYRHQEAYELLEETENPVRKQKRLVTGLR